MCGLNHSNRLMYVHAEVICILTLFSSCHGLSIWLNRFIPGKCWLSPDTPPLELPLARPGCAATAQLPAGGRVQVPVCGGSELPGGQRSSATRGGSWLPN